jgi:hypothetical protein
MVARKKAKVTTVISLQAYLAAAVDFNETGWHPDAKQWKKILKMINEIDPEQMMVRNTVNTDSSRPHMIPDPDSQSSMDSSMEGGETVAFPKSNAPRSDLRAEKPNGQKVETLSSMGEKDADGVVSSGKVFKTGTRDDSGGMGDSEFD